MRCKPFEQQHSHQLTNSAPPQIQLYMNAGPTYKRIYASYIMKPKKERS